MRKLSLTEWAQIGEVVGMVAVVFSLLMVVYSINQNTTALRGSNANLIFERHAELQALFIADESLSAIVVKKRNSADELTATEVIRWEKYTLNLLDIWAMAYERNLEDLLPAHEWRAWNTYFVSTFRAGDEKISKSRWDDNKDGYGESFWNHVNDALFQRLRHASGE